MTEAKRYERYQAWCQLLGVPAAEKDVWRREVSKINELHFIFGSYRVDNLFLKPVNSIVNQ